MRMPLNDAEAHLYGNDGQRNADIGKQLYRIFFRAQKAFDSVRRAARGKARQRLARGRAMIGQYERIHNLYPQCLQALHKALWTCDAAKDAALAAYYLIGHFEFWAHANAWRRCVLL